MSTKYNFGKSSGYDKENNQIFDSTPIIGVVENVNDTLDLGRIQVRVNGLVERGGDNGIANNELEWVSPMLSRILHVKPKKGEMVYIISPKNQNASADRTSRLYIGPIIGQYTDINLTKNQNLPIAGINAGNLSNSASVSRTKDLNGVYPKDEDIALLGRKNTDLILRDNEALLRANKTVPNEKPSASNPFEIKFNKKNPGYIQLRGDAAIQKINGSELKGVVTNIVSDKINLLTHDKGNPRFNLSNQENLISDEEILKILETAHPLLFGDITLEYLILLKNAFLSHVHNGNGNPPTDLIALNENSVAKFAKEAERLEKLMLSKNIRIN